MLTMKAMILLITALFFFRITQAAEGQYWYNCSCGNSDAKVFTNLFEDGCCNDRVECPMNHEPQYLGVDVFMRLWGDYIVYVFILHQQNFLVTQVLDESLKIKEIHTGHLKRDPSEFTKAFTQYCPQDKDVTSLVTGFSVELPFTEEQHDWRSYIVCNGQVLRANIQHYSVTSPVQFTTSTMEEACNQTHPVFCPPKQGYKLISIAVIETSERDLNPYIYGYFAEKRQTEDREKREYLVKAWRWDYYKNETPVYETKVNGYLAEIDIFHDTKEYMMGLYFTIDGNACFFKQPYKDPPNLEIEDLEVPRKPCLSFQAFIGCPTPWCFDIKIDASFSYTVPKKGNEDETVLKVVVFKGFFYWILEDIGLPFNVPSYKYAYKIFNTPSERKERNRGICEDYTGYQNAPVCLPPSVDAAFVADVSGKQQIYIRDSDRKESTIIPYDTKTNFHMAKVDPITGESQPNIQAALFDQDSQTAYLFYPNEYKAYKYSSKSPWDHLPGKSGKFSDSNIKFNNVDAGVNLRDNKAYIFSNNWYYEIIFTEGTLKVKDNKLVGIETFFDIRKECYYNSQDEYFELLSRYKGENRTPASELDNLHARPEEKNVTKERKSMVVFIILILLCGAIIILCVWVAMYVYDRRSRSGQVLSRSKAYHGKKAGKMGSKMGLSPKRRSHH